MNKTDIEKLKEMINENKNYMKKIEILKALKIYIIELRNFGMGYKSILNKINDEFDLDIKYTNFWDFVVRYIKKEENKNLDKKNNFNNFNNTNDYNPFDKLK